MNMRLGDIVYADLAGVRGQADHFSAESIHSDGCGRRVNDDRDAGWDRDFKVHASLFRGGLLLRLGVGRISTRFLSGVVSWSISILMECEVATTRTWCPLPE